VARLATVIAASFLSLGTAAAAPPQGRYDGSWSIEIATEGGACDPLYRYYLVIDGETVRVRSMMGETAYAAAGFVQPNGSINVRFGQASDPVTVRGRLASDAGAGTWVAEARGCRGKWRAARRRA
jgi:hypothetical protein